MNSKIISEWINNKVKVAVILNHKYFNGFNNTAYIHTAGIIKEYDDIGILYENKEKDIFYIPYTSIIEIEPLNINKKRLKMNFDIKDVKSWANRHDVRTLSVTGFFGNSLSEIDNEIRRYNKGEKNHLHELYQISDNGCYCFGYAMYFADTGAFGGTNNFAFFLPLDKVKVEKRYRPFKDAYEFYKFLVNPSLARKDFSNKLLLNLLIIYREIKSPQYTTIELITRVFLNETDKACKIFINKRDFEDWFANYEIMNNKGKWVPFGVEVKEND